MISRPLLPAVFESEDYQTRHGAIDQAFQSKQGEAFVGLERKSRGEGHCHSPHPNGLRARPGAGRQAGPAGRIQELAGGKAEGNPSIIEALEKDLEHIVRQLPQWEKERRDEIRNLNRETAKFAIGHFIDTAKARFVDIPKILRISRSVRADLIEDVAMFVMKSEGDEGPPLQDQLDAPFDRYTVNVLVGQAGRNPVVPIVEELHPTLSNLLGSIEYVSHHGVLVTNFRLIKAGAIHRANGGFLLLDARSLLTEPFSWTALKRTLRQRRDQD